MGFVRLSNVLVGSAHRIRVQVLLGNPKSSRRMIYCFGWLSISLDDLFSYGLCWVLCVLVLMLEGDDLNWVICCSCSELLESVDLLGAPRT